MDRKKIDRNIYLREVKDCEVHMADKWKKQITQAPWWHILGALHNMTLKIAHDASGFHLPMQVHQDLSPTLEEIK